jgi:hypothetical protein
MCPWDKFCIRPPQMTPEEVKKKLNEVGEEAKKEGQEIEKEGKEKGGAVLGFILQGLFMVGKDTECQGCSVFIERLRNDKIVIEKIKELMINY